MFERSKFLSHCQCTLDEECPHSLSDILFVTPPPSIVQFFTQLFCHSEKFTVTYLQDNFHSQKGMTTTTIKQFFKHDLNIFENLDFVKI